MKRISIVLVLLLNSCNQVITTQPTSIKDSKIEEINKENKDIKTKNSGVGSNLILPSSTPKPVITPVPSVIPVVVIPTPLPSTSTNNSSSSQSSFVNTVSSPKASNTPILPLDPDGLPPRPPQANLSNGSAGPSISFADQPPPKPPDYSYVGQLPSETTRDGYITLVFKDEYKIRLEIANILIINDTIKFKTLLNDLSVKSQIDTINQIMKELKITEANSSTSSEEFAYKNEELFEKMFGYDIVNKLSSNTIKVTNQDIASLIKKLRTYNIVRECNFNDPTGNTSD